MPALPTNFRLIDIDAYEDGNLTAEELVDPHPLAGDPGAASSQAKSKAGEVRSMLMKCAFERFTTKCDALAYANSRNDTAGALAVALADAPYGASLHEARVSRHRSHCSIILLRSEAIAGNLAGNGPLDSKLDSQHRHTESRCCAGSCKPGYAYEVPLHGHAERRGGRELQRALELAREGASAEKQSIPSLRQ